MVDLLTNNLNDNDDDDQYEHSAFEVLENVIENDIIRSYSSGWDVLSRSIVNDNNDFDQLKIKINSFIIDYPDIINEIKKYFSDQLIEHILKRLFRVQFTFIDSVHTNTLYQTFFNEQDKNIQIIFNYFIDDIKFLLLSPKFENIPWTLRQTIIYTPKSILFKVIRTWIHLKGAETFTRILYQNLLNPIENQNQNQNQFLSIGSLSFNKTNLYLFIIIYIFILFSINIHIIGTMINCLTAIILIILIFYYSLNVVF